MTTPATTQQAPQTAQAKEAAAVEAYAQIHGHVYAPVFFQKLASDYGIQPQDEGECQELLTIATKLRMAHDMTQQKQAEAKVSARQTFLKQAHSHLDTVLQQQGLTPAEQQTTTQDAEVKAAAATLTLNPVLANAVLQMRAASI